MPLDKCLETALSQSHRRSASQYTVAMAEAQHRQALAGYWPQVSAKAGYQRLSDPLNFIFPASSFEIPAQSVVVPGSNATVTVPANGFAPGFPPATIQLPITYGDQTFTTSPSTYQIPKQNVKVLDQNLVMGSANMTWLLWDGGMRKGYREQSGGWLQMMQEDARRTDLEIIDSVKRMYWGAVLARQLHQLGKDTLERMEATLRLTETMYKEGVGKVTKSDYLDTQVMMESFRSMVAQLEKNEGMSQSALANTMGYPWTVSIQPTDQSIPFQPYTGSLEELVASSYQFSPDWGKLESGLRAAQGAVITAKSAYYPKIALTGELHRWWNGGYNAGLSTDQNQTGWTVGLGMEVPLFDGFLNRNKIAETLERVKQLKEMKFLLQDGLGLQVKDVLTGMNAALKSHRATLTAMQSASDNRDLTTRAYQNELVETDKVIRAQLMEALMSALHYKACYDYVSLLSQLNLVVGTDIHAKLRPQATK
jgi:outer membrane protein TolC